MKPLIESTEANISSMQKSLESFYNDNIHISELVPEDYRDLQATAFMLLAVTNQRADTMEEAADLYEEQLN